MVQITKKHTTLTGQTMQTNIISITSHLKASTQRNMGDCPTKITFCVMERFQNAHKPATEAQQLN
jgi:hypothetical protein